MNRILPTLCHCNIIKKASLIQKSSHFYFLSISKSTLIRSRHTLTSCEQTVLKRFGTGNQYQDSFVILRRFVHSKEETGKKSTVYYAVALLVLVTGLSYAAVPLYRMFCQATAYGGTLSSGHDVSKLLENPKEARKDRIIKVRFNADTASSMTWNFKPQQSELSVPVGETALAFYTAKNPTDKPVDGISTYNVIPFEAGQYFNKIQCFCFEEQRLNPNEQVDLPVFFYIDPEFVDDPKMEGIDSIVLSYTFFEAKDTEKFRNLPIFQHNRK